MWFNVCSCDSGLVMIISLTVFVLEMSVAPQQNACRELQVCFDSGNVLVMDGVMVSIMLRLLVALWLELVEWYLRAKKVLVRVGGHVTV